MPITFDTTDLKKPRILSEVHAPSMTITIRCNTDDYADISALTDKCSNNLTKDITVNGKVKIDGDGTKGTLALSGRYTRNITNCYILPPVQIEYNPHANYWDYTVTIQQDTTS